MNRNSWFEITKKIFLGVLLYSVANVLYTIVDPISSLASFGSNVDSLLNGGSSGLSGIAAFFNILTYVLLAGILIGYALFLLGLTNFSKLLEGSDRNAAESVRNGALVMIIGAIVDFFISGFIGIILYIVGFILMLLGYSKLKSSPTFPEKARNGASKLFTAMLLSLVGAILWLIPIVGGFINAILGIIAFFFILSGWASIRDAEKK
ncbi:MAG: hypothetical protein LBH30_07435 [Prevotellaceae bacterium]|jgi:uncharacterized membrane protein|nr:hypothetical protein [Prevotellaceae bacterium]